MQTTYYAWNKRRFPPIDRFPSDDASRSDVEASSFYETTPASSLQVPLVAKHRPRSRPNGSKQSMAKNVPLL